MYKGRLLASMCALGLMAAAPAFAQTNSPAGNTPGHLLTRGNHMGSAHHEMMQHHRMGRRTVVGRRGARGSGHHDMDRSQDPAVDQLNDQSLQAARQGAMAPAAPAPAPAAPAGKM